jgi:hypothetical protein
MNETDPKDLKDAEVIDRIRIHCERHKASGRATFSVPGIERLLEIIRKHEANLKLRH